MPRETAKPWGARILLKEVDEQEVRHGILIAGSPPPEKPRRAVVVAVGEGRLGFGGERIPIALCPGDVVLFRRTDGLQVVIEDEELVLLDEDDVLATMEPVKVGAA